MKKSVFQQAIKIKKDSSLRERKRRVFTFSESGKHCQTFLIGVLWKNAILLRTEDVFSEAFSSEKPYILTAKSLLFLRLFSLFFQSR